MTISSIFTQALWAPTWSPSSLPDLSGKVALVTGASTGLGKVTATELARKGAHVFCLGRNREKSESAIADIKKETGSAKVEFIEGDLLDLGSMESAADTFLSKDLPLHILVNNAGIMACPFGTSKNGIESQMATNHFAHVVLTNKLLPKLIASQPSRIVVLSSVAHLFAPKDGIHFDDLNSEEKYDPWTRYGETKLANLYFTKILQSRLEAKGASQVYVNAVHPGVVQTELARNAQKRSWLNEAFLNWTRIDSFKGSLTQIFVAGSDTIEKNQVKGKYFVPYCKEAEPSATGKNTEWAQKTWDWTQVVLKDKYRGDWSWAV
jgi:WW domain-containing oxidoreductase